MTEVEWLSCEDPVTMMDYVRDRLRAPGQIDVSDRKLCMFAVAVWTAGGRGTANANAMAAIEKAEGRPPALRHGVSFSPINLAEAWAEEGNPPDRVPQAAKAAILRDLIGNPFRPVVLPPGPPCGACGGTGRFVVGSGEDGEAMACHPCDGTGRQPSPWLTPDVRTLAQAAYEGRVRSCPCGGGRYAMPAKVDCPACNGSGRIDDGTLDPLRLAVLADALEDAGCPVDVECERCNGKGLIHHDDGWNAPSPCRPCGLTGRSPSPSPLLAALRSPGAKYRGFWALDILIGKE